MLKKILCLFLAIACLGTLAFAETTEDLQARIAELEAQVEDLQKQLDETKQADEKEESAEKLKLELELAHTKEAYEALLVAKNCEMHEGNVTFSKAMDTLADLEQYLGTEARAEYEKLLAE